MPTFACNSPSCATRTSRCSPRDVHGSMLPTPSGWRRWGTGRWRCGGATFDSAMRFLKENPDRVRCSAKAPTTPFQMLLRGQNILGYKHYPDDVVEKFVELAVKVGIKVFRVFDALNDPRNMEWAMRCVKKYGGHAQGAICYTISPVHDNAAFVRGALEPRRWAPTRSASRHGRPADPLRAYDLVKMMGRGGPARPRTHPQHERVRHRHPDQGGGGRRRHRGYGHLSCRRYEPRHRVAGGHLPGHRRDISRPDS